LARTSRNPAKNPVEALSSFEGRDVLQSSIKVTDAGDGLSDAMLVDPAEYHLGDTVYVVLECQVSRVDYQGLTGVDALRRVHTLRAGTATVVSPELVSDVLEAQRLAIEKAKGIQRLDLDGEGSDE